MKYRRLWLALPIVLLAVGLVVWVALPTAPFRFLRGHSPIIDESDPAHSPQWSRIYSFRSSQGFWTDADRELLSSGYTIEQSFDDGSLLYMRGLETVGIFTDEQTVRSSIEAGRPIDRPGWVTVRVILNKAPSLTDRIGLWLGAR